MALSESEQRAIICGKFHHLPKLSSKTVRMFISSTFTDTQCERNYLMEHVFPKLRQECQQKYGLAFQVVDMRWGISDTAQDDHGTSALCLKEIHICRRLSIGPSFMCLLGQKYGFRPLPTKLSIQHFTVVREALKKQGLDSKLLDKWYILDENNVPPVHQLRPISTVYPEYVLGEQERNEILSEKWYPERAELFDLLKEGVRLASEHKTLKPEEGDDYFASVTEKEIRVGILKNSNRNRSTISSIRYLENKDVLPEHEKGRRYMDLDGPGGTVNEEARDRLEKLKTETLPDTLSPLNFIYCGTRFTGEEGLSPNTHQNYLHDFGEKTVKAIIRLIELDLEDNEKIRASEQMDEIIQHSLTCEKRCEVFRGRNETLKAVKSRLSTKKLKKRPSVLGEDKQPWVLYGVSGSGKTSLMAKCASEIAQWISWTKPVIIIRFLGTSPLSCDIRQVLESVSQQICSAYGQEFQEQKDYDSLVAYFNTLLKLATEDRPLYILLDSIDQLSSANNAYRLLWLPRSLPPSCHIMISFLPYKFDLLETAQQVVSSVYHFLELTPLESSVCYDVLKDWLKLRNRTHTKDQKKIIKQAFEECSLPLYVRFVFDEVKKWTSHMHLGDCYLETSVKGCIESLFERLENKHGKVLVSHTLGYLTASKTGLSDAEMNDILSLDDEVLNAVFTHWLPPMRRIPGVLWSRICGDLDLYLVEREADGISVFFWYHRQFNEVAKQRYLSDPKVAVYLYTNMADYYRGVWANGRKKPFSYSEKQMERFALTDPDSEADRIVPDQPLSFQNGDTTFYNLRKLNHLPRLLSLSGNNEVLKSEILFNFDWLYSKIKATSLQSVIHDYSRLQGVQKEVKFIVGALSMAGTSLNRNPNCLSVELLGRLMTKRIMNESDKTFMNFLADVMSKGEEQCALQPLHLSYDVPKSYQCFTLEGHKDVIVGMQFSPKGESLYSVSIDGMIANWDLRSGERISLLSVDDFKLESRTLLMFTDDGDRLICDTRTEYSPLLIINPVAFQFVAELGERLLPAFTNTAISSNFACRNGVLYDLSNGKELGTLSDIKIVSDLEWAKVEIDPKERYILVSNRNNVLVIDILTFCVKGKLVGENKPSCILVNGDVCLVGYVNDTIVKFFSIEEGPRFGQCFNKLNHRECVEGEVFEPASFYRKEVADLLLSNDKQLYMANVQRCYLIVFDIELMNVVVMKSHPKEHGEDPSYIWACFSSDNEMVLAVSQKRFLVLWQALTGECLACSEVYNGLFDIRYLAVSPVVNRAATFAVNDASLRVWDLDKMRNEKSTEEEDALIRYDNAVTSECLRVKGDYAFVKHFMPLIVERSFKYTSYFGIDCVHMPTGKRIVILPFDRYGSSIDFDISHNLKFLAVGVNVDKTRVLYFISLKKGNLLWSAVLVEKAKDIRFSNRDSYVVVTNEETIAVYDVENGERALFAEKVVYGKMDPSETFVIGIQSVDPSMRANLVRVTADSFNIIHCEFSASSVTFCENKADHVLVTETLKDGLCSVYLFDVGAETIVRKFEDVVGGIADASANGLCFVDYGLNLYYLEGSQKSLVSEMKVNPTTVQISASGKIIYYLDERRLSVRCLQVQYTAKEIAVCNLHSKPVGLRTFGKGYQIAIGCHDGRLVFLSLNKGRKSSSLKKIMEAAGLEMQWLKELVNLATKITAPTEETLEAMRTRYKSSRQPKLSVVTRRIRRSSSSDSGGKMASLVRTMTGGDSDSDSDGPAARSFSTMSSSMSSLPVRRSVPRQAAAKKSQKGSSTCSLV